MDYNEDDRRLLELLTQALGPKMDISTIHGTTPVPASSPVLTAQTPGEPLKEKKKRCGECNKKLGLMVFPCKCGGEFCAVHRNNADHKCGFDYQADAKKTLSSMLVKVEAKKIEVL
jgi:predicted nucleic acid binding AN1-type Zn finger protein